MVRRYFIDGGFVQVRGDVVTVLTSRAIPESKLEKVAVERELEGLRSRPTGVDFTQNEKTRAVERAKAQLRVAAHS